MFEDGYNLLIENGYKAIGLDHFAKPDDELNTAFESRNLHRNFQGYCTRETTGQVYAFGATGISQLDSTYAQNAKDVNTYVERINSGEFNIEKGYVLNKTQKIIRHAINEIMCNLYISWKEAAQLFETTEAEIKAIIAYDEVSLNAFVSDGLLTFTAEEIAITDLGKYFIRNIAASLDPIMKNSTQKFSKAL